MATTMVEPARVMTDAGIQAPIENATEDWVWIGGTGPTEGAVWAAKEGSSGETSSAGWTSSEPTYRLVSLARCLTSFPIPRNRLTHPCNSGIAVFKLS